MSTKSDWTGLRDCRVLTTLVHSCNRSRCRFCLALRRVVGDQFFTSFVGSRRGYPRTNPVLFWRKSGNVENFRFSKGLFKSQSFPEGVVKPLVLCGGSMKTRVASSFWVNFGSCWYIPKKWIFPRFRRKMRLLVMSFRYSPIPTTGEVRYATLRWPNSPANYLVGCVSVSEIILGTCAQFSRRVMCTSTGIMCVFPLQ